MNKSPFNPDLNGFKTVKYAEVLTTFAHTQLTCEHVFASEDGCADIYTYSQNGEVLAIEFVQLLTVSEWWVKETMMEISAMEYHRAFFNKQTERGANVLTYEAPCCQVELMTLAPSVASAIWDSLTVCPNCSGVFFKYVTPKQVTTKEIGK